MRVFPRASAHSAAEGKQQKGGERTLLLISTLSSKIISNLQK